MSPSSRLLRSPWVQRAIGFVGAEYLRFVHKTNSFVIEPADFYERIDTQIPIIVAMWHGQHFMTPFLKRPHLQAKVMISRHSDGEINAIIASRLGIGTVRGSGDHGGRFDRKGGVAAFKGLLQALAQGCNVAMTADIPKVARVAGAGIVMLARYSGRPIYPVAVATSRRMVAHSWDRMAINLPFGRMAVVVGEPIRVAPDADEDAIERARKAVEGSLSAVTARAYEIVDTGRRPGSAA
jgi:lysophospholipid acyltransferase (LPLAT)-like uncharacterized protein